MKVVETDAAIERPIHVGSPHRSWDVAIGELARPQHGVVARRQLLAMGMGREAITGRLRRGYLHELHLGVYVVGVRRISRKGRWMAAVLACGPDAVLSHRAAACLWGLMPPRDVYPEVTVSRGRRARRSGIICREANLAVDEVDEIDGIPVTSVFRTVLDLAGVLRARELERVWNEVKVKGLTDRLPMGELLARNRGKRGTAALRALLGSAKPEGITRNDFEEAFLALLDEHGLPRPRLSAAVFLRGRFYEIDCLWGSRRLALELDGREVHGTPRAFESDRQRDRVLLAEGYRTTRVTWRQLRDEREEVIADLRSALSLPVP
jgi:very-short-patch-repair endonuclease